MLRHFSVVSLIMALLVVSCSGQGNVDKPTRMPSFYATNTSLPISPAISAPTANIPIPSGDVFIDPNPIMLGKGRPSGSAISPDGKTLVLSTTQGLWAYNLDSFSLKGRIDLPENFNALVSWAQNEQQLIVKGLPRRNPLFYTWSGDYADELIPVYVEGENHPNFHDMALSPNGMWLATISERNLNDPGNVVIIWNVATGQLLAELDTGTDTQLGSLAWSPNGMYLAAGDEPIAFANYINDYIERKIFIWNMTDRSLNKTIVDAEEVGFWIRGHEIAWSPDGTKIASAVEKTLRIWDADTEALISEFLVDSQIKLIAWSMMENEIALAMLNGEVSTVDLGSGETKDITRLASGVMDIFYHPIDNRLIVVSNDGSVQILQDTTWNNVLTTDGHWDTVEATAWSPDGKLLATGGYDGRLILWDAQTLEIDKTLLDLGLRNSISSLDWSPDGRQLVSTSVENGMQVWDIFSGKEILRFDEGKNDSGVSWSQTTDSIAWLEPRLRMGIWDYRSNSITMTHETSPDDILVGNGRIFWSPKDNLLAYADGSQIIIFDPKKEETSVKTLIGSCDSIDLISWSPDGLYMAAACWDNDGKHWDTVIWELTPGSQKIIANNIDGKLLSWSPNSRFLVTKRLTENISNGIMSTHISIWDTETWELYDVINAEDNYISTFTWSPDGTKAVSGGNGVLWVWNITWK